jgi:hypothetical protein
MVIQSRHALWPVSLDPPLQYRPSRILRWFFRRFQRQQVLRPPPHIGYHGRRCSTLPVCHATARVTSHDSDRGISGWVPIDLPAKLSNHSAAFLMPGTLENETGFRRWHIQGARAQPRAALSCTVTGPSVSKRTRASISYPLRCPVPELPTYACSELAFAQTTHRSIATHARSYWRAVMGPAVQCINRRGPPFALCRAGLG